MLVTVQPGTHSPPGVAHAVEDEHPAAAESEARHRARSGRRSRAPQPEEDERQADDPAHYRVQPVGQDRPEGEGGDPERDDDRAVAQRVQRAQLDRLDLLTSEADGRKATGARRRSEAAAPGPASWAYSPGAPP